MGSNRTVSLSVRRLLMMSCGAAVAVLSAGSVWLSAAEPLFDERGISGASDVKFASKARTSGDNAFIAGDYAVAASFYAKYREDAQRGQDKRAERDALERQIDALVLGEMPDFAEKALSEYEQEFPGVNSLSLSMWKGDILLLRGKTSDAKSIFSRILPGLTDKDPRRMRALASLAMVYELEKDYGKASEIYENLQATAGDKSKIGHRAFVRNVLCLAAAGNTAKALEKLLSGPFPSNQVESDEQTLLGIYVTIKESGAEKAYTAWSSLVKNLKSERNPLAYTVSSTLADAAVAAEKYDMALEAYRAAFDFAPNKGEAFNTLKRMVDTLENSGRKSDAADMAIKLIELFKGSFVEPDVKLRVARLLLSAGRLSGAVSLFESVYTNDQIPYETRVSAAKDCIATRCELKDYAGAEAVITSFFTASPVRGEADMMRAELLSRQGKDTDAALKYLAAASEYPNQADRALMQAALMYLKAKNPQKALEVVARMEKELKSPEMIREILYVKGMSNEQADNLKLARENYEEYAKIPGASPENAARALYRAGRISFSLKEYSTAEMYFRKVAQTYPKDALAPNALYWCVYSYYTRGDEIAAERDTWILAEKYPKSEYTVNALMRLANYYADSGNGAKAEAALDKLLEYSSNPEIQARTLYEKALVSFKAGNIQLALQRLNDLSERFPDSSSVTDGIYLNGDILKADGKYQDAIIMYQRAAERRPDSPLECAAFGSIGDCYFAIAAEKGNAAKDYESAVSFYRKLLSRQECPVQFRPMTLCKIGRTYEAIDAEDSALTSYKEVIYSLPPSEAENRPIEAAWAVKAAEAIMDIASKRPVAQNLENARLALRWLGEAGIIDRETANGRMEKLKALKFKP